MNQEPEIELSPELLWSLLTPEEQRDAIRCFWEGHSLQQQLVLPQVIFGLAQVRNFREKFVRERPLEWRINELYTHLLKPPLDVFIDDVIREFLLERRKAMICAILDAEGTPHEDGVISDEAEPPTVDRLLRGLAGVRGKFSDRDLLLYYGNNVVGGEEHFEVFAEAAERPEFDQLGRRVLGSRSGSNADADVVGEAEAQQAATAEVNEEFTTLDNLLIKTVVASATGTDGALPSDALEDLVQEVLTLGADRHRSYFHLGFLDAVLEQELRGEFTGSNVSRRGWYFTGYLMGRLRSMHAEAVVALVKNHLKLWEELLTEGPLSARMMLLPLLMPRLAEAKEWRLLRGLMERSDLPGDATRATKCCHQAYEIAADLVRRGDSVEAVPILQILLRRLAASRVLPEGFGNQITAAALRKLGQAHLRAGGYGEAKKLLTQALEHPDFPEAANARADLGMAHAGFRSLDFLLFKDNLQANETTIKALEKQVDHFTQALKQDGRATNAHFILGLITFHRGRSHEAENHLAATLAGMLPKEAAYQTAHLMDWTRFLLAILIAEECEPARLQEVRGHVECAIASPAIFPIHMWERVCRYLSLYDDQSLAESAIQHVLKKRGDLGYRLLKESGLLTKNEALRTSYRHWLETQKLAPAAKAGELEILFDAAFRDGGAEEATEILDALEGTAKTDEGCIPRFLSLLKKRRGDLLAIWDERDIDNTEVALLERIGNLGECAEVLRRLFYRYRAEGDWLAIEDLLEQIERLKVPEIDVSQLNAQAEHLRPGSGTETSTPASLQGVCVLYVGGNEIQARYEQNLKEDLHRRHPGLSVTFYYPGWTSNWNVHLDKVQRLLPKHNVVVINNFVRTQFGRRLRAACGSSVPWRACTGHGRKSLLHAIELAAHWVAKLRRLEN